MKNILTASAAICLALSAGSLFAEHEGGRDENFWRGHLFQRIREDLDRIQKETPRISADQYRLVATKHDLDDLQNKMEAHRYDQPELDKTVNALAKVTADNNLAPRDRDILQDDLRRLRDFRAHHDGYEAR